jgi:hypothetical protein
MKKIITFGTSCTAGGGFEFQCNYPTRDMGGVMTSRKRGELLRSIYSEKPYTQNNYSYPGQLQKLLNEKNINIEVLNISKQGYGNERIYRKFYDLIISEIDINNCLFIFEFSDLSRKEFYHNPSKNHIIMNYLSDDDVLDYVTLAKSYFYDKRADRKLYNEHLEIFQKYRDEFIEVDNESKEFTRNLLLFLEYLSFNKINFLISAMPELIHPDYYEEIMKYETHCMEFGLDGGKKYKSFHRFQDLEQLTIMRETAHAFLDNHGGLFSNKIIAKNVFNELINRKYIDDEIISIPKKINFKENLKNTLM